MTTRPKEKEGAKQLKRIKQQFKEDTRLGKDDVMPFGKYASITVRQVLEIEPSYLVWWHTNIATYSLRKKVFEQAKKLACTRYMKLARPSYSHKYNQSDIDYDYDHEDPFEAMARDAAWGD